MSILLDTHVLLWWLADSSRLPEGLRACIASADHVVYVSSISLWEARIKQGLGKLRLPAAFIQAVEDSGFRSLPFTWAHAEEVHRLPLHHRDPFDRALVASVRVEGMKFATTDERIRAYDVDVLS